MWDGGTARQLGLIDGFGGMDDAQSPRPPSLPSWAMTSAALLPFEPSPNFADTLMAAFAGEEDSESVPADALATLAPAPEALVARPRRCVRSCWPSIQARCLECQPVVAPKLSGGSRLAGAPAQLGLTTWLAVWAAVPGDGQRQQHQRQQHHAERQDGEAHHPTGCWCPRGPEGP